ncbi:MAG: DHH family phosphoesterase, partial [Prevotella sp.]|nr:DHH family phosphoesterase [Prevotella sp.]
MNIDILTNEKAQQLRQIIDQANGIVICCHQNPDGDAIGSSLGLYEYLRNIGKNPLVIVPDAFPDFLHWMPGTERIIRYDRKKNLADEYIS